MRRTVVGIWRWWRCLAAGCASMDSGGGMAKKPLYDRLGGKPAITAVVDDFIGNVAGDARINKRFATANIPRLKTMLVDQICEASGGPCKYTGTSMLDAHRGMNITDAEFTALVEDLVKSLDKFKVPAPGEERAADRAGRDEAADRRQVRPRPAAGPSPRSKERGGAARTGCYSWAPVKWVPETQGFDEAFDAAGTPRRHYQALISRPRVVHAHARSTGASGCRSCRCIDQGVTFTVYGEKDGVERIFPFDFVPRIIPAAEWSADRGRAGPARDRAQPLHRATSTASSGA